MSKIEVNTVDVQCGSTLTLGSSGKTVQLATGASQSGFGRTGTVDWQTGSIKTTGFTAANGEGYFVDTSSGAVTATLPSSPSPGNIVSFADYTRTFGTNNLTIGRNSSNIGGIAFDAILNVDGQSATFIYVDSTEGWVNVQETQTSQTGEQYITATGGTITTVCTNYKVHTFTGPGTFTVCSGGGSRATVDYLVVAGGGAGGGGGQGGGGGGAGGYRFSNGTNSGNYSAGPFSLGASGLRLSPGGYPITVGAGGSGSGEGTTGGNGGNSIFSTITSAGGGGGGSNNAANDGGSGGGARVTSAGSGNTPSVLPPQGFGGRLSPPASNPPGYKAAGGGGGASEQGKTMPGVNVGGDGGDGLSSSINASVTTRGGGGGGGGGASSGGSGGSGGGGTGNPGPSPTAGSGGTANTGGGGGGGANAVRTGNSGGSGIIIIRYRFQ
jgi:hypothetical protein